MKICPRCQKTYSDESLNFCLDDGAILEKSNVADGSIPATVAFNQSNPTNPNQPFAGQSGFNNPVQFTAQPTPTAQKKSKTWLWALGILGGLAVLCGGGLTVFVFLAAKLDDSNKNYAVNNNNYNSANKSAPFSKTATDEIDLSKWVSVDISGYGNTEFTNGEFVMSSKEQKYYYVLVSSNKYQTENATTKVTVRNTDSADTSLGFGLVFHSNPTPLIQDYTFLIDSENKKYRIVRHLPQDEITVVKWTNLSAIKDGTQKNILEVRDQNKKMSFYINGQFVTTIDNTNGYAGGVPGLYAGNAIPIAFSDFTITK